jgi:hypothetical protein
MATIVPQFEIGNIRDFIERIEPRAPGLQFLWRGQNVDLPLLPKFAREARRLRLNDPLAEERRLFESFKREARPLLGSFAPRDDYEWLALAQHYGLPTRLLDWSRSPLVALWFAVQPGAAAKDISVVWRLDLSPELLLAEPRDSDVFSGGRTVAFEPPHVVPRISSQAGWFTLHKYVTNKNDFIPLDRQPRFKEALTRIVVAEGQSDEIRAELRALGVSGATLFPDLQGLGAELSSQLRDRPKGM